MSERMNETKKVQSPAEPAKVKESKIIVEQVEKRDRNTKYFLTENHGGIAAVYPFPIHYEEDGEWKEIDNSLREENTGEEGYENKAACVKVKFARHGDSKKLVTLKKGNHKLFWGLEDVKEARKEKEQKEEKQKEGKKKAAFRIYGEQKENMEASGRMQKKEKTEASAWNQEKMKTAGNVSGGIYEDIRDGMDLEYLLQGETVKENIILKNVQAAEEPVRFRFSHKGLVLSKGGNG